MLTLYKSSAGSGKTYTLAREYLRLALQPGRPMAFRHILAITFTIKATAEIKERILHMLGRMADAGEGLPEGVTQELAGQVRFAILNHYDDFQVLTIDSFFQRIIRAFAYEQRLAAGFTVELDIVDVIDEAIDLLTAKVGKDEEITQVLSHLSLDALMEGRRWDVRENLRERGLALFNHKFARIRDQLLAKKPQHAPDGQPISAYYKDQLDQHRQLLEEAAKNLVIQAQASLPAGIGFSATSIITKLAKVLEEGDLFEFFGRYAEEEPKFIRAFITNPEEGSNYFIKTELAKAPAKAALPGFVPAAVQLRDTFLALVGPYYTLSLIYANLPYTQLTSQILEAVAEVRDRRNLFLLAEQSKFLEAIIADADAPFILDRAGAKIEHFLIDEMQDTSASQWKSLRPLVENGLSLGKASLLVGDVKQAIYRWRGGDPDLMLGTVAEDLGALGLEELNLSDNWRSLGNIITFNNNLFASAAERVYNALIIHPALRFITNRYPEATKEMARMADLVKSVYADAKQSLPAARQADYGQGYIAGRFFSKLSQSQTTQQDGQDQPLKPNLAQAIAWIDMAAELGYGPADIAILVRGKIETSIMAAALQQAAMRQPGQAGRYAFTSAQALKLSAASCVRLLLAMLRVVQNPDDQISILTAVHEYNVYNQQEKEPDLNQIFGLGDQEYRTGALGYLFNLMPDRLSNQFEVVRTLPIYEAAELLADLLGLYTQPGETAYLIAFLSAAQRYQDEKGADVAGFLTWWERVADKQVIPASEDGSAIHLMTFHKSKGLQFPIVIMPFATFALLPEAAKPAEEWVPVPEGLPGPSLAQIKLQKQALHTPYARQYWEEQVRGTLDNLNLLYVACTRPERMLLMAGMLPTSIKNMALETSGLKTVSDLIIEHAKGQEGADLDYLLEEDKISFEFGQAPAPANKKDTRLEPIVLQPIYHNWQTRLRTASPDPLMDLADSRTGYVPGPEIAVHILHKLQQSRPMSQATAHTQDDKAIQRMIDNLVAEGYTSHSMGLVATGLLGYIYEEQKLAPFFEPSSEPAPTITEPDGTRRLAFRIAQLPDGTAKALMVLPRPSTEDQAIAEAYSIAYEQVSGRPCQMVLTHLEPFIVTELGS